MHMGQQPLRVLAICGSLRQASYNRILLRLAMEFVQAQGHEVAEFNLKQHSLPVYDQDIQDAGLPDNVQALKQAIEANQLLLLASPENNYSITAALKNAIDWASRNGNSWSGKVAAIFGASNGPYGTLRGQFQLRHILTSVNVLVAPQPQVLIPMNETAFTPEGQLINPKKMEQLEKLLRISLDLTRKLSA